MLITNATAFVGGKFQANTDILVQNGLITAIGKGLSAPEQNVINVQGDYLLPGFVDIHIHAFMGMEVMQGEVAIRHMSRELKKVGVAGFLPTTMSASAEATKKALHGIYAVMQNPEPDGAVVLGAHMEAPFLHPQKAGAQLAQYFLLPNQENWDSYVGPYASIVRIVTLAPDREGALDFIPFLCQKGIVVSLGHTNATAETTHQATEAGATHVTHLFNAQSALHHRMPGVAGAALVDDRLYCEVIADGIHLHSDIVALAYRAKGREKLVVITDAMEASGMQDGNYHLGGQVVHVKNGVARLADGSLAGSTLTMQQALHNVVQYSAVSTDDAITMCTLTPAQSIRANFIGQMTLGSVGIFSRYSPSFTFVSTLG